MSSSPASGGTRADPFESEAMLLLESLLLELVGVGVMSINRAIAVVEIALDARDQVRAARGVADPCDERGLDVILATLHRERR